jgi:hypothetical protein
MLCVGTFKHNDAEGRSKRALNVGLQFCALKKVLNQHEVRKPFESGAYLVESRLLQVRNDTLPKERRRADDVQHLVVVLE